MPTLPVFVIYSLSVPAVCRRTAPEGVKVYSPAFDVTPARLITAIISEKGIARPDFGKSLARELYD